MEHSMNIKYNNEVFIGHYNEDGSLISSCQGSNLLCDIGRRITGKRLVSTTTTDTDTNPLENVVFGDGIGAESLTETCVSIAAGGSIAYTKKFTWSYTNNTAPSVDTLTIHFTLLGPEYVGYTIKKVGLCNFSTLYYNLNGTQTPSPLFSVFTLLTPIVKSYNTYVSGTWKINFTGS